jgi:hypothetical protein
LSFVDAQSSLVLARPVLDVEHHHRGVACEKGSPHKARSENRHPKQKSGTVQRKYMTTSQKTRDLARCLLNYEAALAASSESMRPTSLSVYEKLRQSLSEFAGTAAFESLAFRALAQAKSEAPSLWAVQVAEGGALLGLDELEPPIDIDKDSAGKFPAGEGGIILIARLLGLLLIFLGEPLTLSLLRVTWPGAALDNCSSENGRNA